MGSLVSRKRLKQQSWQPRVLLSRWPSLALSVRAISHGRNHHSAVPKGRDVSDKQLAIIYLIGLGIGATEALPIAKNLPGLSPQTRSKAMAFLGTMSREGVEETVRMLQQLLQNSLAQKTYDQIATF